MQKPRGGFCPICGRQVPLDERGRSSTSQSRLDVAAARCSERCAIALRVLVALRELERRDSAGITQRVAANLAGAELPADLSDVLLGRWRRGLWMPHPLMVEQSLAPFEGSLAGFEGFVSPRSLAHHKRRR